MLTITLTSDFGLQSHHLASVKGKILSQLGAVNLIDISNSIEPYNLQQAAYIFKNAYQHFPPDSYHFLLCDLHANNSRKLIYVYENRQHIFCTDNGLLTLLFDDKAIQIFRLDEVLVEKNQMNIVDAFISQVALIRNGIRSGLIPVNVNEIMVKHTSQAIHTEKYLDAQVLYIDNFGNVVLNVTKSEFDDVRNGRGFKIFFMKNEEISTLSESYSDVEEGRKLCLFNSTGNLEIAVNKGSAASLFGFKEKSDKALFYNSVKIFFE